MSVRGSTRIRAVAAIGAAYWTILALALLLPAETRDVIVTAGAIGGAVVLACAAVMLWRSRRRLNRLAYHDTLTGTGNRRAFMAEAERLVRRARDGSLALLLVDVDGLRAVNDGCGQQAGDEALALVGHRLLQSHPSAYRIDGDEFALLIDRSAGQNVTPVLQCLEPFTALFQTCAHEHRLQLSYGYASNAGHDTLDALLTRAGACLQQIKRERYRSGSLADRRATPNGPATRTVPPQITSLEARRRARTEGNITAVG